MALYQAEEKERLRREKTKEAIALATQSRWKEAESVNRLIIDVFPSDAEAYNRLGKALSELGRYSEARSNFKRALELSPYNSIAKKNLMRLADLEDESPKEAKPKENLHRYSNFIAESGKAAITSLLNLAPKVALARMGAGDVVELQVQKKKLIVQDLDGQYLGEVEPRLALRLIRLIDGGNQYEATVSSAGDTYLTIMIRETFKDPSQANVISFPSKLRNATAPSPESEIPRYDLDIAEEESVDTYDIDDNDKTPPVRWVEGDDDVEDDDESNIVEASGFHEEIQQEISISDLQDDELEEDEVR